MNVSNFEKMFISNLDPIIISPTITLQCQQLHYNTKNAYARGLTGGAFSIRQGMPLLEFAKTIPKTARPPWQDCCQTCFRE